MAEEFELEDEIANRIDSPTVSITICDKPLRKVLIWTYSYDDRKYLLIAKLVDHDGVVYRAWADAVRDYIDMTHLRNWIMRDCKDVMDSNGRMLLDKFLQRYKYERPPAVTHTYIAIP